MFLYESAMYVGLFIEVYCKGRSRNLETFGRQERGQKLLLDEPAVGRSIHRSLFAKADTR